MKDNDEINDKVWELLGKAQSPKVSPYFARNVLRAVRQEETRPAGSVFATVWRSLHRWTWQAAIAGTCAVAALITAGPAGFARHHHDAPAEQAFARQIVANPDYEVINHLDELVADEESSLWLDDSVH